MTIHLNRVNDFSLSQVKKINNFAFGNKGGGNTRYKAVSWIEANGTQYIDTGIKPDDTTIIRAKFIMTSSSGGTFIGKKVDEANSFRFFRFGDTYLDYGSGGSGGNRISGSYVTSSTEIYEMEFGNRYVKDLKSDEIKFSGSTVSFSEKNFTINIFDALNFGRLYYFQIFKQGSLVMDLVPVYDTETQKYGMYDNVSQTFIGNAGTGDFTSEAVIAVGTPIISSNRILSNCNNSNYLYTKDLYTSRNHNYKLTTKFRIADLTQSFRIFGSDPDLSAVRFSYGEEGGYGSFSLLIPADNGASWVTSSNFIIQNAYTVANQWMWATIVKEDNLIQLLVSTDGVNYSKIYEYNAGVYISSYIKEKQTIGQGNGNALEIDLNEVKYYLENELSWTVVLNE